MPSITPTLTRGVSTPAAVTAERTVCDARWQLGDGTWMRCIKPQDHLGPHDFAPDRSSANYHVHAKRGGGTGVERQLSFTLRLRKSDVSDNQRFRRGHVPWKLLHRDWTQVRGVLLELLHIHHQKARSGEQWKRVEMVMLGLKLQAISGKCYAKARTFASVPFDQYNQSSPKTWHRTVALLKDRELIRVARLIRMSDNTEAENLIDFAKLWKLIVSLLKKHTAAEVVQGTLWVKLKGFWGEVGAQPEGGGGSPVAGVGHA